MNEAPPRYLLFSIDTESDASDWKSCNHVNLTFKNCESLPVLIDIVKEFGVRPTFLITHAMAMQDRVVSLIEPMLKNGLCEVGAHFHPGDTPPFEKSDGVIRDNILEVPDGLLSAKFDELYSLLSSKFGPPRSFRSGAWTIDSRTISLLQHYGFIVDSSVTPHVSWRLIGRPSYVTAPQAAYYLDRLDPCKKGDSAILEVPVSIWSSKQPDGLWGEAFAAIFSMPLESRSGNVARLIKAIRPYKPMWVRPALFSASEMIYAARKLKNQVNYVHIMCHSNELAVGTSPYSKTPEQLERLWVRLRLFFSYAREQGYIPLTLSEYATIEKQSLADVPYIGPGRGCEQNQRHPTHRSFMEGIDAMKSDGNKTHKKKNIVTPFIKWSVSLGILGFIALHVDFAFLWEKLCAMNASMVLIAVFLTILTNYVNGWKVSLILNDPRVSITGLTNINFISVFFNNILPTRVGGDIIRILYIGKDLSSKKTGAFAVVFDRITGLFVQLVFVLFTCAFFSGKSIVWQIRCLCAVVGLVLILSSHLYKGQGMRHSFKFRNNFFFKNSFVILGKELFKDGKRFSLILVAGYISQCFVVLIVVILTRVFGGTISFFEASLVLFASAVACFLPLSIGGWGIMEGVFTFLYQFLHAQGEIGLAVSLGLRITSVVPSLIGGIAFLKRKTLVEP
jgi:uncharacterized membrane protein YbhN (UPF0104 family)